MRIVLFCHSLVSDWNHGNAHFLRGVVTELRRRGHRVDVFEPQNAWSLANLLADSGQGAVAAFHAAYPGLASTVYDPAAVDLDTLLDGADLVLVHEWTEPQLVARIGAHRKAHSYRLLFHDTHHRMVTAPQQMADYDLSGFDGVLAFGEVLRRLYLQRGAAKAAWTWHEAADTTVFRPLDSPKEGDLVWIGNWGDGERTRELEEFLLEPVRALRLKATIHGVRYPAEARAALARAGITYAGHAANHRVASIFAAYRVTVHVPRRPYVEALPGIPTIRVFEALACGIPLVSAAWNDAEGLFTPGEDYLVARDGAEMQRHLREFLADPARAQALAEHGRQTLLARHTCAHRAEELLAIARELGIGSKKELGCAAD
jgi:spore maturation protein CgeB